MVLLDNTEANACVFFDFLLQILGKLLITLGRNNRERIDVKAMETLSFLASHPDSIALTRAPAEASGPPTGEGYGGHGRAYLGIVPDFAGGAGGLRLAGVREGSPAERAGLRGGDSMVSFDGRTVRDLRDLSYLLKEKKPGDTVVIVVLRDGEEVTLEAVLGKRAPRR